MLSVYECDVWNTDVPVQLTLRESDWSVTLQQMYDNNICTAHWISDSTGAHGQAVAV